MKLFGKKSFPEFSFKVFSVNQISRSRKNYSKRSFAADGKMNACKISEISSKREMAILSSPQN